MPTFKMLFILIIYHPILSDICTCMVVPESNAIDLSTTKNKLYYYYKMVHGEFLNNVCYDVN